VNLLPPGLPGEPFDHDFAAEVARALLIGEAELMPEGTGFLVAEQRWPTVVACGRRVAVALGARPEVPFGAMALLPRPAPGLSAVRLCVVPHPSGRCRAWNSAEETAETRERVLRWWPRAFREEGTQLK
jgi:hypothetical protein